MTISTMESAIRRIEKIDPWIDDFIDSTYLLSSEKTPEKVDDSCMNSRDAMFRLLSGWRPYLQFRRQRLERFRSALLKATDTIESIEVSADDKPYVEHAKDSMHKRVRMLSALLDGRGSGGVQEVLEQYEAKSDATAR